MTPQESARLEARILRAVARVLRDKNNSYTIDETLTFDGRSAADDLDRMAQEQEGGLFFNAGVGGGGSVPLHGRESLGGPGGNVAFISPGSVGSDLEDELRTALTVHPLNLKLITLRRKTKFSVVVLVQTENGCFRSLDAAIPVQPDLTPEELAAALYAAVLAEAQAPGPRFSPCDQPVQVQVDLPQDALPGDWRVHLGITPRGEPDGFVISGKDGSIRFTGNATSNDPEFWDAIEGVLDVRTSPTSVERTFVRALRRLFLNGHTP